jgi:hypothetical protein
VRAIARTKEIAQADVNWRSTVSPTRLSVIKLQCGRVACRGADLRDAGDAARSNWLAPCSRLRSRRSQPGRFMIRSRTRVVQRHPEGDWRAAISVLAVVRPRQPSVSDGCPTAGDGSGFNRTSDNAVEGS